MDKECIVWFGSVAKCRRMRHKINAIEEDEGKDEIK